MTDRQLAQWGLGIAILVAIVTVLQWLAPNFDPLNNRGGHFRAPALPESEDGSTSHYKPNGNNSPTVVSFENVGSRECLINAVQFQPLQTKDTPHRWGLTGAMQPLPINFTSQHYDHTTNQFKIHFAKPKAAPSGEWAILEVAIIEPQWVETTYIGTLTVGYNGNKAISFERVEIDVLAKPPAE